MMWNKIKEVFKERWKFYVVGYVIFYLVTLASDGIQGWESLFPIKIICFIGGVFLGTAFYYAKRQMPVFETASKLVKNSIFLAVSICIVGFIYKLVLWTTGYDISFLIGF